MSDQAETVPLPADAYADFKARAEQVGMPLTAWLVKAGRERALRESMAAYTRLFTEPAVAEQLAAYYGTGAATDTGMLSTLRQAQLEHHAEHKADAAEIKAGLARIVALLEGRTGDR
jgi:hypothetical protein